MRMMDDETLYQGEEQAAEQPAASGTVVSKELLPPEVKVGMHLEVTEDTGDSVRLQVAAMSQGNQQEQMPESDLYSEEEMM